VNAIFFLKSKNKLIVSSLFFLFYLLSLLFLAIQKIGDSKKLEILVQTQSFWNIVGARHTAVPRNSGRDNAAGILII